jgi:hypothetical protein
VTCFAIRDTEAYWAISCTAIREAERIRSGGQEREVGTVSISTLLPASIVAHQFGNLVDPTIALSVRSQPPFRSSFPSIHPTNPVGVFQWHPYEIGVWFAQTLILGDPCPNIPPITIPSSLKRRRASRGTKGGTGTWPQVHCTSLQRALE